MFVANRMAKNPVTVTPDTPVDEAASAMKKGHFRRLPVVENGKSVESGAAKTDAEVYAEATKETAKDVKNAKAAVKDAKAAAKEVKAEAKAK